MSLMRAVVRRRSVVEASKTVRMSASNRTLGSRSSSEPALSSSAVCLPRLGPWATGKRNNLRRHIFESVGVEGDQLGAVTPREAFLPYFHFGAEAGCKERERRDSNPRPPA